MGYSKICIQTKGLLWKTQSFLGKGGIETENNSNFSYAGLDIAGFKKALQTFWSDFLLRFAQQPIERVLENELLLIGQNCLYRPELHLPHTDSCQ